MKHSIRKCDRTQKFDGKASRVDRLMALLRNPRGCCRRFIIAALAGTVLSFGTFAGLSPSYGANDYEDTSITNYDSLIFTKSVTAATGSITNYGSTVIDLDLHYGFIGNDGFNPTTDGPIVTARTNILNAGTIVGSTVSAETGSISNGGIITAQNVNSGDALTNSGTISLKGDMTVTNTITNTGGTISGISANASIEAANLVGGTYNRIKNLYVGDGDNANGNVSGNAAITMLGNNSTATVEGGFGNGDTSTINNVGDLYIGGVTNTIGVLTGSGNGSNLTLVGQIVNAGDITNFDKIDSLYAGNETQTINGDLTGATKTSSVEFAGDLTVNGAIANFGYMAARNVTNNASGTITGTNVGSIANYSGNLVNLGAITEFESVRIGGDVTNGTVGNATAEIVGLVTDSTLGVGGNLNNYATVKNFEDLRVEGFVHNSADGVIDGTWGGSILTVDGADIDGYGLVNDGIVREYEKIFVANDVINNNNATITATGADSHYKIGGDLTNQGIITEVESFRIAGDVTNGAAALITGTGQDAIMTVGDSLSNAGFIVDYENIVVVGNADNTGYILASSTASEGAASTLIVGGNLANGVAGGVALTEWTAESIGADSNDSRDLNRKEYPAYQKDIANPFTMDIALVTDYTHIDVDGAMTNNANGYLLATGAGSVYRFGAFDNAGVLSNIETLAVDGALNPSVFQVESAENTSNPQGDYFTYGTINAEVTANVGDLVNRNGGLIRGSGTGSTLDVSGNMYNLFGSTVRHIETINVAGSLANEGVLEFSRDVKIGGDFVNTLTYAQGNNATGGVLVTDLYNGRVGQITVEGDATINGGELWIGNSGEQLKVGTDYNVIAVKDGHLTVNDKLQIRALNEYDYDTMWEDNAAAGFSSNTSASATPRLFHAEGFSTDTTYYVSLRRDYIYGDAGRTANQRSIGRYMDAIAYTLNSTDDNYEEGDLFNVLSALDNENIKAGNVPDSDYGYSTGNDDEYTYVSGVASEGALNALDQLSGSIYAEMGMMSMQNTWMVGQHLSNFLRPNFCIQCNECNYGMIDRCCCDDDCEESVIEKRGVGFGRNIWGMYYGSTGDVDSDGNSRGFYYHTNGFIVGADLYRNDVSRFGFYGSFGGSSISKDDINQRVESDNYNFGVYGVHEFCLGNLMANASIGRDDYRVERHLGFGQLPAGGAYGNSNSNYVDRWHRGDTESTQANIRMEQSWNGAIWNTVFQPFIAGSYTHMQVDGVNETTTQGDREDGQYVTELISDDYELDSIRSELGLRLSRCLYKNCRTLNLHGHASWVHEFADTNASITNSFTNKNYDTQETGYNNGYNTIANNAFNSNQYNVSSYSISGVDLGDDFVWAGVGLTYDNLCNCATIFGGYDIFANNRQTLHNATLGTQFDW